MATVYEVVDEQTKAFIASVQKQIADGVSFSDARPILADLMNRSIYVAQTVDAAGPDKKVAVLGAIYEAFDRLVVPYDIPLLPGWAELIVEGVARGKIDDLFGPFIDGAVAAAKVVAVIPNPFKAS